MAPSVPGTPAVFGRVIGVASAILTRALPLSESSLLIGLIPIPAFLSRWFPGFPWTGGPVRATLAPLTIGGFRLPAGYLTAPARITDPRCEGRGPTDCDQPLPWSTERMSVTCGRWTWQPNALPTHGASVERKPPRSTRKPPVLGAFSWIRRGPSRRQEGHEASSVSSSMWPTSTLTPGPIVEDSVIPFR